MKKNLNKYFVLTSLLVKLMHFLKTVFYFMFNEIFLHTILCKDEYTFITKNFKCGSKNHIFFSFLSFLSILFSFFLVNTFLTFSYAKNEYFFSLISRYLIINANKYLFLMKSFLLVCNFTLSYYEKIEGQIFLILFSSILIYYAYYKEYSYQIQNNYIYKIFYIFSFINFLSSSFLFIGYLIKNKTFNGLFYVFLIFSILSIIKFSFYNKEHRLINKEFYAFNNDLEVYNQFRLILTTIFSKKISRKNKINLFSFFENKIKVKKYSKLNDYINLTDHEIQQILLDYIEKMIKHMITKFQNSVILNIFYAIFQYYVLNRPNKAYKILYKILNDKSNLSFSQEFFIYKLKTEIENKIYDYKNYPHKISYKFHCNVVIELIMKIANKFSTFWNLILTSNEHEDINKLNELNNEFIFLNKQIKYNLNLIKEENNNSKIFLLYGYYLKDILNDKNTAQIYLNKIYEEEKNNESILDLNNLIPSSNNQFLVVSLKSDSLGIIIKITSDLCQYFGYSKQELIGQHINILIPDFIRNNHDLYLEKRIKEIEFNIKGSINSSLQSHYFYCKNSAKFITKTNFLMTCVYDEDYNPIIFCKIAYLNEKNICTILTNEKFLIEYFTSNCINYLNLAKKYYINKIDIFKLVKELNKMEKAYKNKYKIIKKKFLDITQIITWNLNKKQFKLHIKNMKMFEKTIAYIFEFEDINNDEDESNNLKDSNIFNITNSFLPISKKVFFNYNKHEYLLNQNLNDFDNNYKSELLNFKLTKKNTSKSSSKKQSSNSNSNSFNSNSYNSNETSSLTSTNSYLNEEPNIKKTLNFDHNNNNDNYYQVKLNNVFLKIYNYNKNTFIDIKFNKISKMEEIFKKVSYESELLKKKKENNSNNKNLVSKKSEKISTIIPENKIKEEEKINNNLLKSIENKNINKSIIHLIFNVLLIIFLCFFFPILFHIYAIESKNRLKSIMIIYCNFLYIIDRLYDSFYYMTYLCLLYNENYNNLPQERDFLNRYSKVRLLEIYTESVDLINEITQNRIDLNKNNQEKLDNFNIEFYTNSETMSVHNKTTIHVLNLLNEYYFGIYSLANSKEINFLSIDFNFILLNSGEIFVNKLYDFDEIYMSEYVNKKKNLKRNYLLIIIFFFISIILTLIHNFFIIIKAIQEKEKNLKYFFKIDDNTIKNLIYKCSKYLNLNMQNKSNKNYLISQPKFLIDNNEEDDESFDSNNFNKKINKNDVNNILEEKKTLNKVHIIKKKNKYYIYDKKTIKTYFILISIIIILGFVILIVIFYILIKIFLRAKNYSIILNLNGNQKQKLIILFNFLLLYIGYNTLLYQNELLSGLYEKNKNYLNGLYKTNVLYNSYIFGNISENSFPSETKKLINNIRDNSLCYLLENYSDNNFSCYQLSTNVTNYGLDIIITYYIDTLKYLYQLEDYKIEYANNNSFYYLNIYYGTNLYYAYYPTDSQQIENYVNNNPFNMVNDNYFYDLNILTEQIIKPAFSLIFQKIKDDIKNLFDKLNHYLKYLLNFFYILISIYFIFYIPSFIYDLNNDINKTKKMLNIIPKEILCDLIKNEMNKDID